MDLPLTLINYAREQFDRDGLRDRLQLAAKTSLKLHAKSYRYSTDIIIVMS